MSEPQPTPPHHDHGPQVHRITEARESHKVEQNSRVRKYTISMAIRMACFIAAFFTHGWIQWVCFAGAVFLPYVAVVIANGGADLTKREPPAEFFEGEDPRLLTAAPEGETENPPAAGTGDDAGYDPGQGYAPPGTGSTRYAQDAPETIDGSFLEEPEPKTTPENDESGSHSNKHHGKDS